MLLFTCTNLIMAILLLFCCNQWLIKEPTTQNPFKLVNRVVKYAIKNKHPRCKSAFTYCEDDLPSRIDFSKSKNGGPFTTEQVEDVKTFKTSTFSGVLAGVIITTYILYIST